MDGATYTVDNAGNRTSKTDQRTGTATSYGSDSVYQLLSAPQSGTTTESYTYDPVGNRLSSLGVPYSYNSSNELTSTSYFSYTYDANGNTISKTATSDPTSYTWDYENRLTSVTLEGSGGTVTFKYDPFGRRIYKSSSSGTSIYAYDGDNLIEETNASGVAVARYAQGLNIDEPLAMERSSATSFYEADGLGSITSLTNASGSVAQTYTLDSFGNQTGSSGSLTNSFRYTAREFDTETSLYYYRARYYDPTLGRFASEDPIRLRGGINFYSYAKNNPTNFVDPAGLGPKGPKKACYSWICIRDYEKPKFFGICAYTCFREDAPPDWIIFGEFVIGTERLARECKMPIKTCPYSLQIETESGSGAIANGKIVMCQQNPM